MSGEGAAADAKRRATLRPGGASLTQTASRAGIARHGRRAGEGVR
ncbi:DUF6380 family protein [Streptomyces sp. NPDC055952]